MMIAAELRGGSKPSLNEALGWIGSRVDDIYGANVGRLEDVWIDPGTGAPRWLLVKEGKFGGRTTLIPFEDATAGAGHVWVPYEREVVRTAPEIEAGAPLTQHVEASLRNHYAANVPASISHGSGRHGTEPHVEPATIGRQHGSAMGTATVRFHSPPEAGPPHLFGSRNPHSQAPAPQSPSQPAERHAPHEPHRPVIRGPQPVQPVQPAQQFQPAQPVQAVQPVTPRLPERPAPPIAAVPEPPRRAPQPEPTRAEAPPYEAPRSPRQQPPAQTGYVQPPQHAPQPPSYGQPPPAAWQQSLQPDPAQGPVDQLRALAEAGGSHYVEIELSGELTIRGELRTVRVTPQPPPR